ncbi:MAG: AMP-binding protein [Deltaproteobacteria bacterium]|nr:AMP-binding protein [Deltaproteobacteria bacterium]
MSRLWLNRLRAGGEALALVGPEGAVTYHALANRVEAMMDAVLISSPGATREGAPGALETAGSDECVACVAGLSAEAIAFVLACLSSDVGCLLVHPRAREAERAHAFSIARVGRFFDEAGVVRHVPLGLSEEKRIPAEYVTIAPRTAHVIVMTSGTTGRSKAAVLTEAALVASARASEANLGWRTDDRWLLSLPLSHVGGLSIVLRSILGGRTIVLPPREMPFLAPDVLQIVERERVTLLSVVPTMLKRLLDAPRSTWGRGRTCPPSLRAVLVGGGPASAELMARAFEQGWPVLTTYGLTEASSSVTVHPYGTPWFETSGSGVPLPGVEVAVRAGRIHVRGPTLFSGYLGWPRPFDHEGWFDTADLGRIGPGGCLHVLGRGSELIISGGENVYPREVEAVLEAATATVDAAVVFGVPDPEWGETVAAALLLAPERARPEGVRPEGVGVDSAHGSVRASRLAAIESALQSNLASFKRPKLWAVLREFPRVAGGQKIDREGVKALALTRLERGPLPVV